MIFRSLSWALCLTGILLSQNVSATTIYDPFKILPQVDEFLAVGSFDQEIRCGDASKEVYRNCIKSRPDSDCRYLRFSIEVTQCKSDSVVLKSTREDGQIDEETFTREDYKSYQGNFLRYLFNKSNTQFGNSFNNSDVEAITLLKVATEWDYYLGKAREVINVEFMYDICYDDVNCYKVPQNMTLVKGVPFLAQRKIYNMDFGPAINSIYVEFFDSATKGDE